MDGGAAGLERRACGVLLHPTSLPSRHGVGDVGGEAHRFVEFLARAGQRWWQMLPVAPPGMGPGFSPYSSYSAQGGSPWLIGLDALVEEGWLKRGDVGEMKSKGRYVDYATATAFRGPRLRMAYQAFGGSGEFEAFCAENVAWLDDFALFSALKGVYGGKSWDRWDRGVRLREKGAMAAARRELSGEVRFHQFVQWVFERQWRALREKCASKGIGLMGDIPIFVAYDSVDVWANRELFLLDKQGRPTVVTGCPPDAFAATGQRWGHPQYDWAAHRRQGYRWWLARFEGMASHFDAVRIDHFLGFQRAWHIPARAQNAMRGKWVGGPQDEIFHAIKERLPGFPIIAEDLGVLTPEAAGLRDRFGLPGMRVLQFGFGGDEMHLPHRYVRHCVAYTGTHDNQTALGWFKGLKKDQRQKVTDYLGTSQATASVDMIRAVINSVADTAIFPIQDWLGLDDRARMNVPGVDRGNWRWRLEAGGLTPELARRMRRMAELSGRI